MSVECRVRIGGSRADHCAVHIRTGWAGITGHECVGSVTCEQQNTKWHVKKPSPCRKHNLAARPSVQRSDLQSIAVVSTALLHTRYSCRCACHMTVSTPKNPFPSFSDLIHGASPRRRRGLRQADMGRADRCGSLRRGLCAVTMLDDPLPLRPCPLTRCLRCV